MGEEAELLPESEGIGDGFARAAARQEAPASLPVGERLVKSVEDGKRFSLPDAETFVRTGGGKAQALLDGVEPPNSSEDIDHGGIVVPGLMELAPGVRPASRHDQAPLAGMAFIGRVAVALQDAAEARSKNVVQAAARPARVPLVKARSPRLTRRSRPMHGPKVTGLAASAAGVDVTDRGFVRLHIARVQDSAANFLVNEPHPPRSEHHPVAQRLARGVEPVAALHDGRLPVERLVIGVFTHDHVSDHGRRGLELLGQTRSDGSHHRRESFILHRDELRSHRAQPQVARRTVVEPLADFLADAPIGFRRGLHLERNEDFFFDRQMLGQSLPARLPRLRSRFT